jgi:hypothetical protein
MIHNDLLGQALHANKHSHIELDQRVLNKTINGTERTDNRLIPLPDGYHPIYAKLIKDLQSSEYHPSRFHIALITSASRTQYLSLAMRSLSQVLFWNKENTILFQYGDGAEVGAIANQLGVKYVQNPVITKRSDGKRIQEGADHIAHHYRFVFDYMFNRHRDIKHFIVIEDDMLFAPDFLLYFSQVAPIMANDSSIYAISAYNDNGFKGKAFLDNMVYRTEFFIGFGWLVSRAHWENEWKRKWPLTHWDNFLRLPQHRRGRQTLYPEISRVFHAGYKGTHSSIVSHEQYFRDIFLNSHGYSPLGISADAYLRGEYLLDGFPRTAPHTLDYLIANNYETFFLHFLNPKNPDTVYISNPLDVQTYKHKNLVFFLPHIKINDIWLAVARYYGLWHTIPIRNEYNGVVMFRFNENWVFAIHAASKYYQTYLKQGHLIDMSKFQDGVRPIYNTISDSRKHSFVMNSVIQ